MIVRGGDGEQSGSQGRLFTNGLYCVWGLGGSLKGTFMGIQRKTISRIMGKNTYGIQNLSGSTCDAIKESLEALRDFIPLGLWQGITGTQSRTDEGSIIFQSGIQGGWLRSLMTPKTADGGS